MKTNYLQRPCLGINQSLLFNASDDMAQNASSRADFSLHPEEFMGKYGVDLLHRVSFYTCFKNIQKTSEICTPMVTYYCVIVSAVQTQTRIIAMIEVGGLGVNNTITGNSYIGIV